MSLRIRCILVLTGLLAAAPGGFAFAESKAKAMVDAPSAPAKTAAPATPPTPAAPSELALRCKHEEGTTKLLCAETTLVRTERRLVEPGWVFGTSLSLHTANNLSTAESATKLLRSVTGSPALAKKATPAFLRLTKSMPARYGLVIAVLGSGAIAVYERFNGDNDPAAAKPSEIGTVYVAHRKLGEFDSEGNYTAAVLDKKP